MKMSDTRFVLSVEQMAPYLEEIQSEIGIDFDGFDEEIQQITMDANHSDTIGPIETDASPQIRNIPPYEQYVNYLDCSQPDPGIVEAALHKQPDALIETELCERLCGACSQRLMHISLNLIRHKQSVAFRHIPPALFDRMLRTNG